MKLLKKIWSELTRVRKIEFISYETEEETNERLQREFKKRLEFIKQQNYKKTMQVFINFHREVELAQNGILLSDLQLLPKAQKMFLEGKRIGRIDGFNRLKEVV